MSSALADALAQVSNAVSSVADDIFPDRCLIKTPASSVDARGGASETFTARTVYKIPCFVEGTRTRGEIIAGAKVTDVESYVVTFPATYNGEILVVESKDQIHTDARDTQSAKVLEITSIDRTDGVDIECACTRIS